jgi:sugar phosphate isomerase/epimerase
MKTPFPFRLGTTSYILHDDILPNIRFLKDKVDNIELLLFESDQTSNYPSSSTIKELNAVAADSDLTYTVHLPLQIPLATRDEPQRRKNTELMLRAIEATAKLNPHAWELHLEPDAILPNPMIPDIPAWQNAALKSLNEIKASGIDPQRIGIETLEYDFQIALPVIEQAGFGFCLDIGHIWFRRFNEGWHLKNILPRARSFHLHGFNDERDHKGLNFIPQAQLRRFTDAVSSLPDAAGRVVTIEVFSEHSFKQSMEALNAIL